MSRLAFYTFGVLKAPVGDPRVQGFFDRADTVLSHATASVGFIALDDGTWGPRAFPGFFDRRKHHPAQVTLSLWTDLESVCAFAYRGVHLEAFKKRRAWAEDGDWPRYVAWWVDDDEVPTPEEACARLQRLYERGPTPSAFDFRQPYDEAGRPRELDRDLFRECVRQN
ncbi:MAG TPA: DUF3291 domain-containing protein, partial [Longimicrobiales bacterium]|nr:DUF3291 domain-containing protein [Longimicrobiales bacterium]